MIPVSTLPSVPCTPALNMPLAVFQQVGSRAHASPARPNAPNPAKPPRCRGLWCMDRSHYQAHLRAPAAYMVGIAAL